MHSSTSCHQYTSTRLSVLTLAHFLSPSSVPSLSPCCLGGTRPSLDRKLFDSNKGQCFRLPRLTVWIPVAQPAVISLSGCLSLSFTLFLSLSLQFSSVCVALSLSLWCYKSKAKQRWRVRLAVFHYTLCAAVVPRQRLAPYLAPLASRPPSLPLPPVSGDVPAVLGFSFSHFALIGDS